VGSWEEVKSHNGAEDGTVRSPAQVCVTLEECLHGYHPNYEPHFTPIPRHPLKTPMNIRLISVSMGLQLADRAFPSSGLQFRTVVGVVLDRVTMGS